MINVILYLVRMSCQHVDFSLSWKELRLLVDILALLGTIYEPG